VSGLTGGSSNRLIRADIGEVYVPLKRRVDVNQANSPKQMAQRASPENIKTV